MCLGNAHILYELLKFSHRLQSAGIDTLNTNSLQNRCGIPGTCTAPATQDDGLIFLLKLRCFLTQISQGNIYYALRMALFEFIRITNVYDFSARLQCFNNAVLFL